jgi:dTDP-4-dehydrorhamnose 3,5-epimerase
VVIETPVFQDDRGFFLESYHEAKFQEFGLPARFVQDNHSHSGANILRGLHYQLKKPQGKLIRVVFGSILDVAVDIRTDSPHFGHWVGVQLDADGKRQLYVPPGFAHGFYVLSESADVLYKCSDFYDSQDDRGIHWADPNIGIEWPAKNPILSGKDSSLPTLAQAREKGLLPAI